MRRPEPVARVRSEARNRAVSAQLCRSPQVVQIASAEPVDAEADLPINRCVAAILAMRFSDGAAIISGTIECRRRAAWNPDVIQNRLR